MVATFMYSLAGGILAVAATGRPDQIAWKFLRLIALLAFGLTCGVTAWQLRGTNLDISRIGAAGLLGMGAGMVAMVVVFLTPLATRIPWPFRAICLTGGLLGLAAACLSAQSGLMEEPGARLVTVWVAVGQILSGALLGSITVAWLLGHAYLTATRMTILPLRHFSRLLLWAVGIRAAFVPVSLSLAWVVGSGTEPSILIQFGQAWLVLTLRLAVGILGVALFAYMVSDCVRLRSTQSATGILYFGSVFAYIGELASLQLVAECGWPL